jgi:hypothetical protein
MTKLTEHFYKKVFCAFMKNELTGHFLHDENLVLVQFFINGKLLSVEHNWQASVFCLAVNAL